MDVAITHKDESNLPFMEENTTVDSLMLRQSPVEPEAEKTAEGSSKVASQFVLLNDNKGDEICLTQNVNQTFKLKKIDIGKGQVKYGLPKYELCLTGTKAAKKTARE